MSNKHVDRLAHAQPEGAEASRTVVGRVTVTLWSDGAMSVVGPVDDPEWMLAALEHAADAARTRAFAARGRLLLPPSETSMPPGVGGFAKP